MKTTTIKPLGNSSSLPIDDLEKLDNLRKTKLYRKKPQIKDVESEQITEKNTKSPMSTAEKKIELENMVLDYLFEHPRFFKRHSSKLNKLAIPADSAHQNKDTLSLIEKQLEQSQAQINQLQVTMARIEAHNKTYMELLQKVHRLECDLLSCINLSDMLALLDKQCHVRLRYTPQIWLWAGQKSTNRLKSLVATPELIEFAKNVPALSYLAPMKEADTAIAPYVKKGGEGVIMLPLAPPIAGKKVLGLLMISFTPSTISKDGYIYDDYASYQKNWLANRFTELVGGLIESHLLRELKL